MSDARPLSLAILTAALALLPAGCTRDRGHEAEGRKAVDMRNFEEDVAVPAPLYNRMLELHEPAAAGGGHGGGHGGGEEGEGSGGKEGFGARTALRTKPPTEQVALKVFLAEKSKGILGHRDQELRYPAGGGFLDYKLFLQGSAPGYFKLGAEIDPEEDGKNLHVFYLSRSRLRKIGERTVGNGCGRYFDISRFWRDSMKKGGIELYTGDNRHVSLTAGTYFFVLPSQGRLKMAHLTVRDTRFKDLECPP